MAFLITVTRRVGNGPGATWVQDHRIHAFRYEAVQDFRTVQKQHSLMETAIAPATKQRTGRERRATAFGGTIEITLDVMPTRGALEEQA